MNAFRIIPEVALRVPEPRMHQRHCAKCPSAHGPDDPESADVKTWPLAARIETMFVCAWGPRRYCRGYCDAMGISHGDVRREHAKRYAASADTRPQGGDSTEIEAPFTGGAVVSEASETHNTDSQSNPLLGE